MAVTSDSESKENEEEKINEKMDKDKLVETDMMIYFVPVQEVKPKWTLSCNQAYDPNFRWFPPLKSLGNNDRSNTQMVEWENNNNIYPKYIKSAPTNSHYIRRRDKVEMEDSDNDD